MYTVVELCTKKLKYSCTLQLYFVQKRKKYLCTPHCDLKVSRSKAKIDERFANYFFKTKGNNNC